MATKSREELLALFPDIAGLVDKLENSPQPARFGQTGIRRPKAPKTVKTVKPCKGVASYKAINWVVVAQNRRKVTDLDMGRVVISSGRKRRKGKK